MKLRALPSEKAKDKTRANFEKWKREKAIEAIRAQQSGPALGGKKARSEMSASVRGKGKVDKKLTQEGAHTESSPNMQLWRAISRGDIQAAEAAIARGADISGRKRKTSPLVSAAGHGRLNMVKFLISKGIDVNARCEAGTTPLMAAAHKGHYEVAEILIHSDAGVNVVVDRSYWKGMTALMFTAFNRGNSRITRLLLENGADANILDAEGNTALSIAKRDGNAATERVLREFGATK